jgi:hypothetical protein
MGGKAIAPSAVCRFGNEYSLMAQHTAEGAVAFPPYASCDCWQGLDAPLAFNSGASPAIAGMARSYSYN